MFGNCYNLKNVIFKNCTSLYELGSKIFQNDSGITNLDFSECTSLKYVNSVAFQNCTSLTEINFSGCTLSTISSDAFNGCSSLSRIIVKDEDSKQKILAALQSSGLNTAQIEIVIKA